MKSEIEDSESDNSTVSLKQYLSRICPPLLFPEHENRNLFESSLSRPDVAEVLAKFATSSDFSLLLVELTEKEGMYLAVPFTVFS